MILYEITQKTSENHLQEGAWILRDPIDSESIRSQLYEYSARCEPLPAQTTKTKEKPKEHESNQTAPMGFPNLFVGLISNNKVLGWLFSVITVNIVVSIICLAGS